MSQTAMLSSFNAKLKTEVQHQSHNNDIKARKLKYLESTIHRTPQKLNFIFDKSLGLKIKSYEIDFEQIILIAEPKWLIIKFINLPSLL